MHVFIQGIHVFNILNPVESGDLIFGELEIVNLNRFKQKMGYLERGDLVFVLAGGREAIMESPPLINQIQLRLRVRKT